MCRYLSPGWLVSLTNKAVAPIVCLIIWIIIVGFIVYIPYRIILGGKDVEKDLELGSIIVPVIIVVLIVVTSIVTKVVTKAVCSVARNPGRIVRVASQASGVPI